MDVLSATIQNIYVNAQWTTAWKQTVHCGCVAVVWPLAAQIDKMQPNQLKLTSDLLKMMEKKNTTLHFFFPLALKGLLQICLRDSDSKPTGERKTENREEDRKQTEGYSPAVDSGT